MANLLDCIEDVENLGLIKCNKLPQMPKLIIETPPTFFLTPTEALLPATWQTKLKLAKGARIYLYPEADVFEDKSEAAVYETTPLNVLPVRPGRYQFLFQYAKSLCYHKAMFSHKGKGNRFFILDIENQLFGMLNSDGNFQGFTSALLNMEKLTLGNGTVATKSPLFLVLADSTEVDKSGVLIDGTFVNDLFPLTDAEITVITQTTALIKISVLTTCDNTPVLGLVVADFTILTTAGAAQVILACTDNGDGTYSFTKSSNFLNGTINLKAASALTIDAYESTGAKVITPV